MTSQPSEQPTTSTKLTTEQQKALNVMLSKLDDWKSLLNREEISTSCTYTNFFTFSVSPIRREHLPHDEHWVWNQSNAKLAVKIFDGAVTVTIQKFNARKKPKFEQRQPSYKLWIFTLEHFVSDPLYAIWCEKGKHAGEEPQLVAVHPRAPIVNPEELQLQSFDFLRSFVAPETAVEFGWIKPYDTPANQLPLDTRQIRQPNRNNYQQQFFLNNSFSQEYQDY